MHRCVLVLPLLAFVALAAARAPVAGSTVDFEKQVWPILQSRCTGCHGASKRTAAGHLEKPKGGVQLDSVAGIRASRRGKVIVAGKPSGSLLFQRISLQEGDEDIMPPAEKGGPLASKEVELIRTWIEQGASYGRWQGKKPEVTPGTADGVTGTAAVLPPITSLAFAPDGKSVVAGSQAGLQVYDWPQLSLQETVLVAAANLHDVAFSPAGDHLAVGGGDPSLEGVVETFSWPGKKSLRTIKGHEDSVKTGVWRDQRTLASASLDSSIALWDIRSGAVIRELRGHSRGVTALCFLPDGKTLVSAGIDQSLRVWDLEAGEVTRSLNQHTGPVHALALRPGEGGLPVVASAAADRSIRFWQPTIGRMVRYARLASSPLDIAWLDGSRVVAACADGRLRVVDWQTVRVTLDLAAVHDWACSLAVHPSDGSVVVGGADGQVRRVVPVVATATGG